MAAMLPRMVSVSSTHSGEESPAEDEDVFEITDFTNASDWEKFISQIEESITEWQLNNYVKFAPLSFNELATGEWESLSTDVKFSSVAFTLNLHRLKQKEDTEEFMEEEDENELNLPQCAADLMNINNDFPARAHCLARWYGLRCFLVLVPVSSMQKMSHSKCNLLRSSANIALHNTSCDAPLFVQLQESWQRLYKGCAISQGMSTNFEMTSLKRVPPPYSHLSGLLHIFKSKLICPTLLSDNCQVSARFTYVLNDWGDVGRWPAQNDQVNPDAISKRFSCLPSGCLDDPISELQLAALWPSTTGDLVIDNNVHSGFDPLSAHNWSVRLCYTDDVPCLLSFCLAEFTKVTTRSESMSDFHIAPQADDDKDIGHALDRIADAPKTVLPVVPASVGITKVAVGLSKVVVDSHNFIKRGAVTINRLATVGELLPADIMHEVKRFLFGAAENEIVKRYPLNHQLKAAPVDSLTHRLATTAAVLNLCHGGVWAVAQLWHAVVTELRHKLDAGQPVPGLDSLGPDHRTCLLHQKLQMLNCCIARKNIREMTSGGEGDFGEGRENLFAVEAVVDDVVRADEISTGARHKLQNSSDQMQNVDEYEDRQDDDNGMYINQIKSTDNEAEKSMSESKSVQDDFVDERIKKKIVANFTVMSTDVIDLKVDDNTEPAVLKTPTVAVYDSDDSDEFFECDNGVVIPPFDATSKKVCACPTDTAMLDGADLINAEDIIESNSTHAGNGNIDEVAQRKMENEKVAGILASEVTTKVVKTGQLDNKTSSDDIIEAVDESDVVSTSGDHSVSEAIPEGRLHQLGNELLLQTQTPLYVPITQQHALLTEDQLEEQAAVFSKLGDSSEGSKVRAKMQSVSLQSDMEAFKAANPGCNLADFVRWYSPRDYDVDGLSPRMLLADNLWQTTWNASRAVPATRQKRLFDDTKEAEKVLHFLANLKPCEVARLLMPVCVHDALIALRRRADTMSALLPTLALLCERLEKHAAVMFRNRQWQASEMNELLRQVAFAETLIERTRSLQHKFRRLRDPASFVRALLEHPEVMVTGSAGGEIGSQIRDYFRAQQNKRAEGNVVDVAPLPEPIGREFILRARIAFPSPFSRRLPQRMYALLRRNEFRLASAVSGDTTFF